MGFDAQAFLAEKFEPRVIDVDVPDLKPWFGDSPPVWKVRGLTGDELGRINEAVERNRNVGSLLEGLVAPGHAEKVRSVRELFGVGDKVPDDIVKRMEILITGSMDPVCDMDLAIRLKDNYPIEFMQITNKILWATGKGRVPGKLKGSGEIPPSEPA